MGVYSPQSCLERLNDQDNRAENIAVAALAAMFGGLGLMIGFIGGGAASYEKPGLHSFQNSKGAYTVLKKETNPIYPTGSPLTTFTIWKDGSRLIWVNSLDSLAETEVLALISQSYEVVEQVETVSLERGSQRLLRVQDSSCIENITR